nr:MAG TPA: hypothetical protein [Caudoviricetes sp.]
MLSRGKLICDMGRLVFLIISFCCQPAAFSSTS